MFRTCIIKTNESMKYDNEISLNVRILIRHATFVVEVLHIVTPKLQTNTTPNAHSHGYTHAHSYSHSHSHSHTHTHVHQFHGYG